MTGLIRQPWWGPMRYAIGEARKWQLGSLEFSVQRERCEWQIAYHRPTQQDEDQQTNYNILDADAALTAPVTLQRFLFSQTSEMLSLLPRLADRPVVVRPLNPIIIPPGEQGTLYVSTPLWLAGYPENQKSALFDLPIVRPSDTWFGQNMLNGSLCYATPVFGRTDLTQLPPRPFRAVTPILLRNQSNAPMQLQRLSLPVPALSLYRDAREDRWWTPTLDVTQDNHRAPPRVRIESVSSTAHLGFVQPPRAPESTLLRMFDSWFE